jgi:UDPglucose 6-dehydrogenase
MGLDNRIGRKFLHPGPGYGGSCFPKDTSALQGLARAAGCEMRVVDAVIEVNERQPAVMMEKVRQVVPEARGKVAAVLGLSFKPNTDDIRESPAIKVIEGLQAQGFGVRAYDPIAVDNARGALKNIIFCEDEYSTAEGSDLLVLATEWNQFRALDLKRLRGLMKAPVVVDLRNIYEPEDMARLGFTYRCVGRPVVNPI